MRYELDILESARAIVARCASVSFDCRDGGKCNAMSDSEVNASIESSTDRAFRAPAEPAGEAPGGASFRGGSQVESDAKWESNDGDDENLDRYLTEFLKSHNLAGKLCRGGPEEEHPTEQAGPRHESGETDFAAEDDGAGGESPIEGPSSAVATAPPPPRRKPEPTRRPPSSPPESHDDLNAMRQLAVSCARGAIKVHAFRKSVGILRCYFLIGVTALLTSTTLVLRTSDPRSSTYLMAVGSFAVAAMSCLGFLRCSRKTGRVLPRAIRQQLSPD